MANNIHGDEIQYCAFLDRPNVFLKAVLWIKLGEVAAQWL